MTIIEVEDRNNTRIPLYTFDKNDWWKECNIGWTVVNQTTWSKYGKNEYVGQQYGYANAGGAGVRRNENKPREAKGNGKNAGGACAEEQKSRPTVRNKIDPIREPTLSKAIRESTLCKIVIDKKMTRHGMMSAWQANQFTWGAKIGVRANLWRKHLFP